MRILVLLALFTLALTLPARAATIDTSFEFSTVETPHFAIHYHQGLEEVARRSAAMAEEIHTRLAAIFPWEPGEKTQLVLMDDSDFANGLTTVLPYNVIILQPVPPAPLSAIGEYDDWLRTILTHEYTHVITSDPARGYSKVTRRIFGKPVPAADIFSLLALIATGPPNVFMPRWWHEGMATWGETELTGKGRGRSSFFEMVYRSAVAEERLPSIDKLNGEVPYWPGGDLPYLFGTRLMAYIADSYGSEALGQLTVAQSGRFPYFINSPPEDLFNERSYPVLYREMLEELKLEQGEKIALLKKSPLTPVTLLGKAGDGETAPRFSPDGRLLAFNRADRHGHPAVVIAERDGKTVKTRFRRLPSDDALSWAPDGKQLFFSQAEIHRGFDVYQDLYAYDLERGRVTRLTRGLRTGEPDISPDGSRFAVVLTSRGSQNLALLDARELERGEKAPPRIITGYSLSRVSSPRWSPDGRSIAYTLTDNAGRSSLRLYDVAAGSERELFGARYTISSPAWTRDGQYLLYSADETGVFNIFAFSMAENRSRQVTHVIGGAFQPDMAPDGATIVFSSYGAKGFTLAAVGGERSRWSVERSPSLAAGWRERENKPPVAQTTHAADLPSSPYSPWPTLAPRFWLPALAGEGKDGTAAGALTAGQDVLGYHSYLAELLYGTKFRKLYYDLAYRNDLLYPTLQLRTYALPALYTNLLQRGDYTEINRGLIAQTSVPLNNIESRLRFTLGFHLQDQKALSPLRNGLFNGLAVFQGRRDNAFATLAYADALKYPWSISREEGRNLSITARYYGPETGSDLSSREYLADYEEFFHIPGPVSSHHVLVARLSGGIADGGLTPQQAFQLGGLRSFLNPFALRGYPERSETGKYVVTGTLEHRFPAWYILRGFSSKPIFLDRLHGAAFVDAGQVWDNDRSFRSDRIKVGAGAEARLDMTIGYWARLTPAVGYAHGFNQGGEDRLYFTIYVDL